MGEKKSLEKKIMKAELFAQIQNTDQKCTINAWKVLKRSNPWPAITNIN